MINSIYFGKHIFVNIKSSVLRCNDHKSIAIVEICENNRKINCRLYKFLQD